MTWQQQFRTKISARFITRIRISLENVRSANSTIRPVSHWPISSRYWAKTRIKLLSLLAEEYELCVCDIAESLQMGQSAISHQLRVLRAARLVKFRKAGKEAFYSLDDDHVVKLMRQGLEHVREI